jgi:hypothetical protein
MLLAIPLVFAFIEPSSALPLILDGVTRRSRDGMNVISSGYSLVTASFFFPISFLNRPACRPFFEETEPDAGVYIGPRRLSLYGGGSASRLL